MRWRTRNLSPSAAFRPLSIVVLAVLLNGCLAETRRVQDLPPATLRKATLEELVERLERIASPQSLAATVELELTVVNDDRDKETTYKEVRGAVVGRRPASIRVQAQLPVTGQRAFDMTTAGETFQVYLAWRNRIYQGDNTVEKRSEKRAENIRPQHILEPLLIEGVRDDETPVLMNTREGRSAYQVIQILRETEDQSLRLARSAWFNRIDFNLDRYLIYDDSGDVVTRARYQEWTDTPEGPRPGYVRVYRPEDGYDLAVRFLKPGWDAPVDDEAFELDAPENVEVVEIGDEEAEELSRSVNEGAQ